MAVAVTDIAGASRIPVVGGTGNLIGTTKRVTIGAYATNGVALVAADLGLASILMVLVMPASGYTFEYDYTANKLKAYRGDNTNAAAAPGVEVSNGVDLSAVTAQVFALGTAA